MTEPILFSGAMVRSLLAGTKTQTRQLLTPQPDIDDPCIKANHMEGRRWRLGALADMGVGDDWVLPIAVGDRLDPAIAIEDFPDYCVGISGRVYSQKYGTWKRLAASPTSRGYPALTLCRNGARQTSHVHTLTCEAFHGPRPSEAHQVRHIDGDQTNGCAANLCWGTQSDNWRDRKAHGNGCEGEKHHNARFSDEERAHIQWGYSQGLFSQRHAARTLGVRQSSIHQICQTGRPSPVEQDAPDQSHMRLTLTVTDVRVQRLQEISEEDARAEGAAECHNGWWFDATPALAGSDARGAFFCLWQSINGPGSWARNEWVAAYTFSLQRGNIDSLARAA